jgi:hypothetical protein
MKEYSMSITRREVLGCVVAGGLVLPAGAASVNKEPLTPEQAWHLEDQATITVRFEVRKEFAISDDGEVWLFNLMSSDRWADAERFNFHAHLTDRCRKEFGRIGVTKLAAHFAGRVVTVRGKVSSVTYHGGVRGAVGYTGGTYRKPTSLTIVTLTIDSLDQFVSVQ